MNTKNFWIVGLIVLISIMIYGFYLQVQSNAGLRAKLATADLTISELKTQVDNVITQSKDNYGHPATALYLLNSQVYKVTAKGEYDGTPCVYLQMVCATNGVLGGVRQFILSKEMLSKLAPGKLYITTPYSGNRYDTTLVFKEFPNAPKEDDVSNLQEE